MGQKGQAPDLHGKCGVEARVGQDRINTHRKAGCSAAEQKGDVVDITVRATPPTCLEAKQLACISKPTYALHKRHKRGELLVCLQHSHDAGVAGRGGGAERCRS